MSAASILGQLAGDAAGGIFGGIGSLIGSVRSAITGTEVLTSDARAQIESSLTQLEGRLLTLQEKVVSAQQSIIVSEAQGDSWLQRNWRPITMLTFVALIVAHWLGWTAENLGEPERLAVLEIVKIGLGGYVVGRSVEKSVKYYSERNK
jgi:hypothetical protein